MKKVKLGEVCEILSGYAFKSSQFNDKKIGLPLIRIRDVERGFSDTYFEGDFPKEYLIHRGDLLITMDGSFIMKKWEGDLALLNQRVCKLRITDENVDEGYLSWMIPKFLKEIEDKTPFVTVKHLSVAKIKNISFFLPDIQEQKIISKKLDTIRQIYNFRKKQSEKYNELVKSRFNEMFGDLLLNEFKWDYASFNEFAKFDTKMISDFSNFIDLPHIGIDSIEKNTGKLIGYRTVGEDQISSGKYLFTKKHIIYSKIRPNLNKVALPDFMGVCSADAYPILTVDEKMNRIFLAHVLRSDYFLNFILSFSSRTNLPKVNKSQISKFVCPLPPLSLQNEFADFVAQVDKSQLAIQKSLEELETLKISLLLKNWIIRSLMFLMMPLT